MESPERTSSNRFVSLLRRDGKNKINYQSFGGAYVCSTPLLHVTFNKRWTTSADLWTSFSAQRSPARDIAPARVQMSLNQIRSAYSARLWKRDGTKTR